MEKPSALAILVILVLGILWAAVLVPPILRSRSAAGAAPSGIGDFVARLRSGLGATGGTRHGDLPSLQPIMAPLGPTNGSMHQGSIPVGPVQVPGGMTPTQRRRRDVLIGLAGAVGVTFLMALMAGSPVVWLLQLVADGLLGGYIYLLLQFKARNVASGASGNSSVSRPAGQPLAAPNFSNVTPFARRQPQVVLSHVDVPREASVLALRRTASW